MRWRTIVDRAVNELIVDVGARVTPKTRARRRRRRSTPFAVVSVGLHPVGWGVRNRGLRYYSMRRVSDTTSTSTRTRAVVRVSLHVESSLVARRRRRRRPSIARRDRLPYRSFDRSIDRSLSFSFSRFRFRFHGFVFVFRVSLSSVRVRRWRRRRRWRRQSRASAHS